MVEGDLSLSTELTDLGDGVFSAGEGDDFKTDPATRTPARPLGRPLRLASAGGAVAASVSTPLVEAWISGGPSILEVSTFAAAAEALDEAGVVSAYLVASEASFEVTGVGMNSIDGRAGNAIVYAFVDEASAAAQLDQLDNAWRNGQLASLGVPVSDFFDVQSVEQVGSAVLVTAAVTDQSTTTRAIDLMIREDPLLSIG